MPCLEGPPFIVKGENVMRVVQKNIIWLWCIVLLLGVTGCGRQEEIFLSGQEAMEITSGLKGRDGSLQTVLDEELIENAGKGDTAVQEEDVAVEKTETVEKSCVVYLCGAVKRPGVYTLQAGDRLYEAVEMAGGFQENAFEEYVNQARTLQDGEQIYIPTKEEAEEVLLLEQQPENSGGLSQPKKDGLVNINTADVEDLCTLKGIGMSRAEDIVAYREANGAFEKIEDIKNVTGIKEGLFQKIKDKITV